MGSDTKKISALNLGFMLLFAICFDVLTIIPFVNIVVNFIAGIVFAVWYFFLGISFSKNKGILGRGGVTFIVELVPFLSIFPTWTLFVIVNYITINRNAKKALRGQESKLDSRSAFERLRNQRTHTAAEIFRLNRAREIMRTGQMRPGENRDEVAVSAMEEFKKKKKKIPQGNGTDAQLSAQERDEARRADPRQRAISAEEALRMKVNRTTEEQAQLRRAEEIERTGRVKQGEVEKNPVYRAAYEKKTNPDNNPKESSKTPVEY